MIDPPWWLVVLPMAGAPLIYLIRRWEVGTYLASLIAVLTAWLAWNLPPTNPMRLLGRSFVLDPLTQQCMALLFALSAALFLADRRLARNWYFSPLALVVLGLFAVAGMARHLGVVALALVLAAIASVPIIQGDRVGSTRATWRFLVMMTLALPFLLLASWQMDAYRENSEANLAYAGQALVLLLAGVSIWLAVTPLHGWLSAVGAEASPVASAFVLTGFPLAALIVLIHVLTETSWLTWSPLIGHWLLLAGLLTALTGGLLAVVQRSLRPMFGYAALFDLGCLLIALAIRGPNSDLAFYSGLAVRALGLSLSGVSIAAIQTSVGEDGFGDLAGTARRLPLATTALLAGGLTLAGLPLSAGFPTRWSLLRDLTANDPRLGWLVVAGSLGVALAHLRALRAMLAPSGERSGAPKLVKPGWQATLLLVILTLTTTILGLFPDALFRPALYLIERYPLPHP